MPSSHHLRWSSIRILAAIAIFIAVFFLYDNGLSSSIDTETETKVSPRSRSPSVDLKYPSLSSGVGLVTTDGAWGKQDVNSERGDIKILGFTDRNYLPIARLWYGRLSVLVGAQSSFLCRAGDLLIGLLPLSAFVCHTTFPF